MLQHHETQINSQRTALTVLSKLRPQLLAHIRIPSHLKSTLTVEDILQDIARTILRTTLTVDYSEDDWTKVIFAIAFRQLRKQVRRSDRERPPSDWTQAQTAFDSERIVDLLDSLSACTPRQKRIIGYRLSGLSLREISENEGICEASVRRVLHTVEVFMEEEND